MNLPKLHFHLIVPCHIYFSSTCRNSLLLDIYQKIIILTVSYDIIHSWNSNICTLHVIIHSWNSNICKLHVQKPPPHKLVIICQKSNSSKMVLYYAFLLYIENKFKK
jgi:hypothetical protein